MDLVLVGAIFGTKSVVKSLKQNENEKELKSKPEIPPFRVMDQKALLEKWPFCTSDCKLLQEFHFQSDREG